MADELRARPRRRSISPKPLSTRPPGAGRAVERERQGLGRAPRPAPGRGLRPRARGRRGRGLAGHVPLRRARRGRVDAGPRVHRRRGARRRVTRARPKPGCGVSRPARSPARCRSSPSTARPAFLEALADQCVKHGSGPTHLSDDFELVAETFRRFADDKIRPVAEHVHRTNADVPEDIIAGLAELGGFGLSVPEEYDGFATGGESDYMGMVVATEELSRLARHRRLARHPPEILTRALVAGGTEEQKQAWLPRIASGEVMVGIMVTEPDYGSDVAGVKVTATPTDGGWLVNGVKTWATFAGRADVLMLLAHRSRPFGRAPRALDPHRREAPRRRSRVRVRRRARREDRRSRDRHDRLPRHALLRGRVRQLVRARHATSSAARPGSAAASTSRWPGFENGRLQTAARAVGLMQAAFEAGLVVRAGTQGVRRAGVRLPALEGQARAHGRAHPGRPPVLLRRRRARWPAARARSKRRW